MRLQPPLLGEPALRKPSPASVRNTRSRRRRRPGRQILALRTAKRVLSQVPRSPQPGRRESGPAIARQHRYGYAASLHNGLRGRSLDSGHRVATRPGSLAACNASRPYPPDSSRWNGNGGFRHRFLSYGLSYCLPDLHPPAVPVTPVVVRAAPPSRDSSRSGSPSASVSPLRQAAGGVLSPPPGVMTPRGAPRSRSGCPSTTFTPGPIYIHQRDSIEASLTIVFAARAVSRWIEDQTCWSIKKLVHIVRRHRTIEI
jgi:hypothetical protein